MGYDKALVLVNNSRLAVCLVTTQQSVFLGNGEEREQKLGVHQGYQFKVLFLQTHWGKPHKKLSVLLRRLIKQSTFRPIN